jgi:hypothetical protein
MKSDHSNREVRDQARTASADLSKAQMRLVRSDQVEQRTTRRAESRKDRVLAAALTAGVVSATDISSLARRHAKQEVLVTWRDLVLDRPAIADSLREIAASMYGFRSMLICEVGTLVYNDLLTALLTESDWQRLFEEQTVPVVEYGQEPRITRRHLLGSPDPGAPAVRKMLQDLPLQSFDLVYIPLAQLTELHRLLISRIPQIGVAALTSSRTKIRVLTENDTIDLIDDTIRRAA